MDQNAQNEIPNIVQVPLEPASEWAGVPDGTVMPSIAGRPDEKVVYDFDENAVLLGWHKEQI